MKTEKEKMLAGELYDPCDNELAQLRSNAHRLSKAYNATHDTETEQRKSIIDELLPLHAEGCYLEGPVCFDYGMFTKRQEFLCQLQPDGTGQRPRHHRRQRVLRTELHPCHPSAPARG